MSSTSGVRGRSSRLQSFALEKESNGSPSVSPKARDRSSGKSRRMDNTHNNNHNSNSMSRASHGGTANEQALQLEWVFGLSKDYKAVIYNLSTSQSSSDATSGRPAFGANAKQRGSAVSANSITSRSNVSHSARIANQSQAPCQRRVFYAVGHVGIIYDAIQNTQTHLLGHVYSIIASSCSENKRFIVTADEGDRRRWARRGGLTGGAHAHEATSGADSRAQIWSRLNEHKEENEEDGEETYDALRDDDNGREDADAVNATEVSLSSRRCNNNNNASTDADEEDETDVQAAHRADEDDGSVMIVWDTQTGLPVRRMAVGPYGGVQCCAMSSDGMYIATINRRTPQELMLWGWTAAEVGSEADEDGRDEVSVAGGGAADAVHVVPELMRRIPSPDGQTSLRFSSDDVHLLCSNGRRRVFFWSWAEGVLKYYSPPRMRMRGGAWNMRTNHGTAAETHTDNNVTAAAAEGETAVTRTDAKAAVPHSARKRPAAGQFTQTIYIPGTELACSGTVEGDVVLWQAQPRDRVHKTQDRTMLKMVRVHHGAVTCVTSESGYIVTGGMDGHVRFFDIQLRLVAWFEELQGGPVVSISFDRLRSKTQTQEERRAERHLLLSSTAAAAQFAAPDFMVSTAHAMIIEVPTKSFHAAPTPPPAAGTQHEGSKSSLSTHTSMSNRRTNTHNNTSEDVRTLRGNGASHSATASQTTGHATSKDVKKAPEVVFDFEDASRRPLRRGRLIVQGQDHPIQCVAAHPLLTRVAIAGLSGNLHIWDYAQRRVLMLSLFRNLPIQCVAYDPSGSTLAVGFTTGQVKMLDADSLEARQQFKPKRSDAITMIRFSDDGRMMATGSESGVVGLYERQSHVVEAAPPVPSTLLDRNPSQSTTTTATTTIANANASTSIVSDSHSSKNPSQSATAANGTSTAETVYWEFIGHHKTHRAAICGLQFAHNTQGELIRLLSVGRDKRLIEYNLLDSSPEAGLLVRMAHKITQGASPTSFLWTQEDCLLDEKSRPREGYAAIETAVFDSAEPHEAHADASARTVESSSSASGAARAPPTALDAEAVRASVEPEEATASTRQDSTQPTTTITAAAAQGARLDYLVIATDAFKLGVYMSDYDRQCVKTLLAPTFGGPLTRMAVIPSRRRPVVLPATSQSRPEAVRESPDTPGRLNRTMKRREAGAANNNNNDNQRSDGNNTDNTDVSKNTISNPATSGANNTHGEDIEAHANSAAPAAEGNGSVRHTPTRGQQSHQPESIIHSDTAQDALHDQKRCMVYITEERVMGLIQLPLRGDPTACMGLIAHPQRIADMTVSYDGAFVFTAGGSDNSVMQWTVDARRLRAGCPESDDDNSEDEGEEELLSLHETKAAAVSTRRDDDGVPLDHLLAVVEGGELRRGCATQDWGYEESPLIRDIVDYFYYAQIRAQGEATTAKRELLGAIRFAQMPNLMRALGYYPSELEMGHLAYEVANMYGPREEEMSSINVDSILLNFAQFMRLYVNYRAVRGVTRGDVEAAFRVLAASHRQRRAAVLGEEGAEEDGSPVRGGTDVALSREELFRTLATRGEPLGEDELQAILTSLLGDEVRPEMLDTRLTARNFAKDLLGFEDFDEDSDAANREVCRE